MNDRGWIVGSAVEDGGIIPTLWRDGAVHTLDVPDVDEHPNGSAFDVNENGVIAVRTFAEDFAPVTAYLVKSRNAVELPGTRARPASYVTALNDHGTAAGSVRPSDGFDPRPVVWKGGELIRLPVPRGTLYGEVSDINNFGLAVGFITTTKNRDFAWYWRVGGRSGALLPLDDMRLRLAGVVDDRDRIVSMATGHRDKSYLWDGPTQEPGLAVSAPGAWAMTNHGDVLGNYSGGRTGGVPWVARLGGTPTRLVDPPLPPDSADTEWADVRGQAIIRGVTPFAPEGGISVAGYAWDSEGLYPVLWTCVQLSAE